MKCTFHCLKYVPLVYVTIQLEKKECMVCAMCLGFFKVLSVV